MKSLLLFLLILCASFRGLTQSKSEPENFKDALLKTKDGAKLVYTGEKHSFTLDIISKDIKPTIEPNFISIDNLIFQSVVLPFKPRPNYDSLSKEQQQADLMGYMQEHLNYLKKEMKLKYEGLKHEWVEINNRPFLLWYYDMPKTDKQIDKQIYLSTLCFDQILNLNTPVIRKKDDLNKNKELLLDVAKTLKLNNSSIDVKKLYKELRRG